MNILNLYAGLGGNRKHWNGNITSVEMDPLIAGIYEDRFIKDHVVVGDAHLFLEENFNDYDFIWSSPPCQTHSSFRQNMNVRYKGTSAVYPDMKLYQEIVFLKANCSQKKWAVENVNPYYEPLIEPSAKLGRHLFWSNFHISYFDFKHQEKIREAQIPQLSKYHGINLSKYKIPNKRQLLRNCVDADLGLHVMNCAMGIKQESNQLSLFGE